MVINGERVFSEKSVEQPMAADRTRAIARFSIPSKRHMKTAIDGALKAKHQWERRPLEERVAVFLKAAALLANKDRFRLVAATMLGQGKTAWQAEIDAATELCDFWRLNAKFATQCEQLIMPDSHAAGTRNRAVLRPLEGFVLAASPFNFTAIGGNLASAPALMGNAAIWKPSSAAVLSNYLVYEVLEEAGLPPGVIQFVPGPPDAVVPECMQSADFAGLHFTGSTAVFRSLYKQIVDNLSNYKNVPRIVGETGGKNFHVVHQSADLDDALHNTVRAAFEYQGQKCSACSRLNDGFRKQLVDIANGLPIARTPEDLLRCFLGPMINKDAHDSTLRHIERAVKQGGKVLCGGASVQDAAGYAIQPTIIQVNDPKADCMTEEIFGPVLAVFPYKSNWPSILDLVDSTSKYGLTGAIFATDRNAIAEACDRLFHAAGNLYINDKSTGAVVGQQAFGGARASGTNDKAGSPLNLLRWTSPQVIKENFVPLAHWSYPHIN